MKITTRLTLGLTALAASPLFAQSEPSVPANQAVQKKLVIFDDEPCPPDTICVVAPSSERYRIPKHLRQSRPSLENQSWTVRSQDAMDPGRSGIEACSNGGGGSWTGCFQKSMQEHKRIREEIEANARAKP